MARHSRRKTPGHKEVGLQPPELEAKALQDKARIVCSYAKKEQGNTGAREVVSFHTELQALEQCQGRARGRDELKLAHLLLSFFYLI